ncbi:hypothetical protein EYF80_037538 [Liparis tanakae]|uniref:Uncharacterized protein n=1 Tax=Liparis tanakae TaxID=230148 RepID=A0A4Z2GHW9_9TELE|nr:hypothetical protein EYF80_037538 [Liparis tanakae]
MDYDITATRHAVDFCTLRASDSIRSSSDQLYTRFYKCDTAPPPGEEKAEKKGGERKKEDLTDVCFMHGMMAVYELLSGLFAAARVSRPFSLSFLCSGEGSFQIVKQTPPCTLTAPQGVLDLRCKRFHRGTSTSPGFRRGPGSAAQPFRDLGKEALGFSGAGKSSSETMRSNRRCSRLCEQACH